VRGCEEVLTHASESLNEQIKKYIPAGGAKENSERKTSQGRRFLSEKQKFGELYDLEHIKTVANL
jgi:hypothetical protein